MGKPDCVCFKRDAVPSMYSGSPSLAECNAETNQSKKHTSTNKLETLFVETYVKYTELLYYICILLDCGLERQLLMETMA